MSDTNLKTPVEITVSNVSDKAVGMVPYRECFAKRLDAHSSLTFTVDTAEQLLYYKKQGDRKLSVATHGADEASIVAGVCTSDGVFTEGSTFAFAQDGDKFVVNGFIPYRDKDSFSVAGTAIVFKITNPNILDAAQLPAGKICKITNTELPSGFNEYDKSAFESDGSLVVVFAVNYNTWASRKVIEVKVAWTKEDNELVWTNYTIVLGDVKFGKKGEEAPEIVNTTIAYPQNVTFTNTSDHKISLMPYKQNVTFAVDANSELTISITKPELVMYYLEQTESNFAVTL